MKAEELFHPEVLEAMRRDVAEAAALQKHTEGSRAADFDPEFAETDDFEFSNDFSSAGWDPFEGGPTPDEGGFRPDSARRRPSASAGPTDTVEILWVGRCDENGHISDVSAAARGSADMVPALFPHMARGDSVIHNHPGGDLRPSGPDLQVASRLGNAGIGFIIINDSCTEANAVAAPLPSKDLVLLDIDDLAGVLEPGGALSAVMEGYEEREEQVDLLRMVASSFNASGPVIAEAGTGVGKSFAYLLPALKWASENDERVVVSTATIALQQQLMEKDIPLATKLLGVKVRTALVKGRGNYLCLKRLSEAAEEEEMFSAGDGLQGIRDWAASTDTGSRSELPFKPDEGDWAKVRCEAESCPGAFCSQFEDCFLMKARRKAAASSLLVANHHLLFADLSARQDGAGPDETVVLPAYRRIVLDEAHHAEASATSLFTRTISLPNMNRALNRIHRRKGRSSHGLALRISAYLPENAQEILGSLPQLIENARGRAETMDALARDMLDSGSQLRLVGEAGELEKSRLVRPMDELRRTLSEIAGVMAEANKGLEDLPPDPETEGLAVEVRQALMVVQEALATADHFIHRDEYPDRVFWIESRRRSDGNEWLEFHVTPLSVANLVRETVWEPFETVVAVSATLAVGGGFDHWKKRIGADRPVRTPSEGIFPSPFDYASRVLLGVPSDIPSPEDAGNWEAFLVQGIVKALELSGGHALILFTSYETLRKTISGVRSSLSGSGPLVLAQGEDDRGRLLKRFRETASSVLFATDSFWEGVDVPGDALKLVVITRLPFRPPTDPVAQARRDALAAAGGNPFMHLTLPEAVIRFRQGFGRLMRRQDDKGAVLVFDPRVLRKRYGSLFLESLPATVRSVKGFDGVLRDLEDHLF